MEQQNDQPSREHELKRRLRYWKIRNSLFQLNKATILLLGVWLVLYALESLFLPRLLDSRLVIVIEVLTMLLFIFAYLNHGYHQHK